MEAIRNSKKMVVTLVVSVAACAVAEMGDVRLKGYLGDRLDAMILRHVVGTDVDYITAPFLEKTERRNWWQSEFWGNTCIQPFRICSIWRAGLRGMAPC